MTIGLFRNSLAAFEASHTVENAANNVLTRAQSIRALAAFFAEARRSCGAFEWVSLAYLAWITHYKRAPLLE